MSTFDLTAAMRRVHAAVDAFACDHGDEDFYAFAIDAGMLCLSSEQGFARTVADYRARWESPAQSALR